MTQAATNNVSVIIIDTIQIGQVSIWMAFILRQKLILAAKTCLYK